MKKYLFLSSLCAAQALNAQTVLNNQGAIIKVQNPSVKLRVEQGSIVNNGSINNAGAIYLDRNFTQAAAGSYTATASSWLWFEGSSTQTVQNNGTADLVRVKVQNGNKLQLLSNLSISHTLDLSSNSDLELGNFNLNCPNTNLIGYNSSSYIISNGNGSLIQQMAAGDIKEYPIGRSSYNPVILLSNSGATDDFSVRVEDQLLSNGNTGTAEISDHVNRTWHISEALGGGNNMDISVEWAATDELTLFDRTNSSIKHWNGSSWDFGAYSPATNSAGRYSQSRSNVSSFSPFAVADFASATLPIELLHFSAQRNSPEQVILSWATASELNNDRFELERMLDTETEFSLVGSIRSKSEGQSLQNYQQNDFNPHSGISYYRLKQVDKDGSFSHSELVAVQGEARAADLRIFPNPSSERAYISGSPIKVQISNQNGQVVSLQNFDGQTELVSLPLSQLPAGSYTVQIWLKNGQTSSQQLIKN